MTDLTERLRSIIQGYETSKDEYWCPLCGNSFDNNYVVCLECLNCSHCCCCNDEIPKVKQYQISAIDAGMPFVIPTTDLVFQPGTPIHDIIVVPLRIS